MSKTIAVVVAAALAACLPGETDTPEGAWPVDDLASTDLEPGQLVALHVHEVDVEAAEVRLWVDEHAWPPLRVRTIASGELEVLMPLPVLEAGAVRLAVGTDDEVMTRALEVDVTVPAPRLSPEEVAAALTAGLSAMVQDVRGVLTDPDPLVQEAVTTAFGEIHGDVLGLLDDLDLLAAEAGASYLEIEADQEAAYQAWLERSGLLSLFEELAAGPIQPIARPAGPGPVDLLDRLPHPVARALFHLDATSAALSALGDVVSVANIVALVTPGGQAISAVGFTGKMVIVMLRAVIDVWAPTDLRELEPQSPPVVFENEPASWIYWGKFEPQSGLGSLGVTVIDQIISVAISEIAFPKQVGDLAETVARDLVTRLLRSVPSLHARINLESFNEYRAHGLTTICNMQAYDLTLGDLTQLVPVFGVVNRVASYLVDFEVVSPFTVDEETPRWADDADFRMDYADDIGTVYDLAFPTDPTVRANVRITAEGYRFRNQFLLLANPPWPDFVSVSHPVEVRSGPDPTDRNDLISDEAYIVVGLAPADGERIIWDDTLPERRIRMELHNLRGSTFGGETRVNVFIGGITEATDVLVPEGIVELTPTLSPGLNTITIEVTEAHELGSDTSPSYHAGITVEFPDAINADKEKGLYGDVGLRHDLLLYMPPPR